MMRADVLRARLLLSVHGGIEQLVLTVSSSPSIECIASFVASNYLVTWVFFEQSEGVPCGTLMPFAEDSTHPSSSRGQDRPPSKPATPSSRSARPTQGTPSAGGGSGTVVAPVGGRAHSAAQRGSSNGSVNSSSHGGASERVREDRGKSLLAKVYASVGNERLQSDKSSSSRQCAEAECAPAEDDVAGTDDACFVCGLGGHLLLCDFPQCVRAYHQVPPHAISLLSVVRLGDAAKAVRVPFLRSLVLVAR
jgi:hypothetical protein